MNRLTLKNILIVLPLGLVCGLTLICIGGFVSGEKLLLALERRQAQQILGVPLPDSNDDFRYFKYRPNLAYRRYEAYIRFKAPEEAYLQLMEQMEMNFIEDGDNAYRYFWPGLWKGNPRVNLEWWNPKLETSKNAAAKDFGSDGWMLATYEQGYVFITAFDPGPTSQ